MEINVKGEDLGLTTVVETHRLVEGSGVGMILRSMLFISQNTLAEMPDDYPHRPMWVEFIDALDKFIDHLDEIYESAPELPADE